MQFSLVGPEQARVKIQLREEGSCKTLAEGVSRENIPTV